MMDLNRLETIASGVLWVHDDVDLDAFAESATGDGYVVAVCDVDTASTKQGIIENLGGSLRFPDWAGANLDALYDLLTDLSWLDDHPVLIILRRDADAQRSAVDGWQGITQVIIDAAGWWQPEPRVFLAVIR